MPIIGDYGVIATGGLAARLIRFGTDSTVNHAFVYIGGGQIVEADPGGARISPLANYDRHAITWSTPDMLGLRLSTGRRLQIVKAAKSLVGRPYGWLDIVAIALAQRRLGATVNSRTWWVRRVQSLNTLICSQLVDLAYGIAGVELFDDGRLPGLVSPGDLLTRLVPSSSARAAA